jgi:rubrerythrin
MDQGQLKELLEFQINRNVINLYKSFLIMMEDMHDQHNNNFRKLKQALPEEIDLIDQADYWDESRMDYLRKKILDKGNDSLREIISQIEQFNLTTK